MEQITVGVIGCGAFGEKHIAAYSRLEDVSIQMVCDSNIERAEQIAKKYNVPHWTTDYEKVVANPSIQAVSIVSPETCHFEHTMAAFTHNKHVLVEKPMATTVKDTDEMIAAARQKGLVFMPGHILRFEPRYVLAYERLQSIGKIHSIYCKRNLPRNLRSIYTRVHPAQMTLPHDLDAVLWYTNDKPKKVYAMDNSTQKNGSIDMVWALVEFSQGTIACFESSWLLPERAGITPDSVFDVIAEHGKLNICYPSNDIVLSHGEGDDRVDTSLWPEINGLFATYHDFLNRFKKSGQGLLSIRLTGSA